MKGQEVKKKTTYTKSEEKSGKLQIVLEKLDNGMNIKWRRTGELKGLKNQDTDLEF